MISLSQMSTFHGRMPADTPSRAWLSPTVAPGLVQALKARLVLQG